MIGKCFNAKNGFWIVFVTGGFGNCYSNKKDAIQDMTDTNRYTESKYGERTVSKVVSIKNGEVVREYAE